MPKARGYLSDGQLELDNNTCERSIRPIALGRKNYLFMGSTGGGKAAAIAYTLIETAKMNNVVVSRMWWKFSGGDLRALGFGPDQATRSRVIGSMG